MCDSEEIERLNTKLSQIESAIGKTVHNGGGKLSLHKQVVEEIVNILEA